VLGRFLLRFILVPLGAAVSTAVMVAFVVIAHWGAFLALINADPQAQENYFFAFLIGAPILALLLSVWGAYMSMSALVGILISEAFAVRSWIFHACNGGLSAWLGWALTQDMRDQIRVFADPLILVAAGLAAGFAYWMIAGWTAGFWKPVGSRPAPDHAR
jgi:hypothetical protein